MTRREKRYYRRNAKRQEKRAAFMAQYDNFDRVFSRKNLYEAANLAKKHVIWKASVQGWSIQQLLKTEQIYNDLHKGKDVRKGFSKFTVYERGKVRNISAVRFYERVVQKCLCKNALAPVLTKPLIFDNSASQKGKGVKFAQDRLIKHLKRYFRKNGNNGYALLVDFKNYFGNINHEVTKENTRKYFQDERILRLCDDFIDAYGDKGLGLGSETSQINAIYYPNVIDHAMTENQREKVFLGRYMDDTYILAKNKATLRKMLDKIGDYCKKLKIVLSPKKTRIVRIKDGIMWLKTKFFLLKSGRIIKKPCHKTIVRQRRKLKKQLKLLDLGIMTMPQIIQSLESWAGGMKRRNARLSVWKMRQLLWRLK